ncbi:ECF RNA polymerase sigma factor SigK [Pseudonocardia eucalypti]|uniref:ECF RNA polymerase sigma factor SigK n=1 Tax=Pseudonocardia eucalypti TaxID=648755 RepID=A0ABP9PPE3_9PSEU|nr:RNA polymerase sigma-70 factor (ECF subfamily) [Pseudonocardia eucalypti]
MDGTTWPGPAGRRAPDPPADAASPEELLQQAARGDERAFELLYDQLCRPVFGLVRRVVRDLPQSEEVTQEVFVELWRTASRFDPDRGSALSWTLTLAHRRAVDRVRSDQARGDRERRAGQLAQERDFDTVAEAATRSLEREQLRRCLNSLSALQRQSVQLAYYDGRTYHEVAALLDRPLGTIKTRMRDGLIRLRDCLGVTR